MRWTDGDAVHVTDGVMGMDGAGMRVTVAVADLRRAKTKQARARGRHREAAAATARAKSIGATRRWGDETSL